MTAGRPGGGNNNLWRDLAAVVVQEVSDRLRAGAEQARTRLESSDRSRPLPPPAPSAPPATSLGGELKKLVEQGIRATTSQIVEHQSEKERRRAEQPMRRAQARATGARVGAGVLGGFAAMTLVGGVSALAADQPVQAIPPVVITVGAGAGAAALVRRGRAHQREADAHAKRLGAASASAVSLHGASAYTVPLPPQTSRAYEPTRRLIAQKAALAELLPDVEEIAPELGPLAVESERTLSGYAGRIVKLERAQAAAGGSGALDGPLTRAVEQYVDGVEAHQKLVEAAATVLAELASPHVPHAAYDSITEAADRLQGLAEGLRQVRHDIPIGDLPTMRRPPLHREGPAAAPTDGSPRSPAPRSAAPRNRRRDVAG
ncbi:phage shock envelope stress response protein PspM [Cumulibacter manganitolerans]|uniref:phage shock envelope stress response protein PspM n=1 Tax=Cumulibacter manganitolerans TaxID=1884992 RepID=UPI0012958D04|nr:hypothetical protein [Cumulibacter manganitolerans]